MGSVEHVALIVTCYDGDKAREAYNEAVRIFGKPSMQGNFSAMVTVPQESVVNGYWSFAILPDGSKLGWGNRR